MNKKGQVFAIVLMAAFIFILVAFTTIEPIKENLDEVRKGTNLNCIGTTTFDQTSFDNQTTIQKLTNRPTCFVTGMSMVWFIGAFIFATAIWAARQIRRLSKK